MFGDFQPMQAWPGGAWSWIATGISGQCNSLSFNPITLAPAFMLCFALPLAAHANLVSPDPSSTHAVTPPRQTTCFKCCQANITWLVAIHYTRTHKTAVNPVANRKAWQKDADRQLCSSGWHVATCSRVVLWLEGLRQPLPVPGIRQKLLRGSGWPLCTDQEVAAIWRAD